MLSSLKRRVFLTEKQMRYFTYEFKKATNFGKLYLPPKIHKRVRNVSGRLVIFNWGSSTEKEVFWVSWPSFETYHSKKASHILKTNKTKNLSTIPGNAILVKVDVVGLYPSIPHEAGLRALGEALDEQNKKSIRTEDLFKMAGFVLKKNYLSLIVKQNGRVQQSVTHLHHHMRVFSCTSLKKVSLKCNNCNP